MPNYDCGTIIQIEPDSSSEVTVKAPMEAVGAGYKDLVSGMALSLPSTLTLGGYG